MLLIIGLLDVISLILIFFYGSTLLLSYIRMKIDKDNYSKYTSQTIKSKKRLIYSIGLFIILMILSIFLSNDEIDNKNQNENITENNNNKEEKKVEEEKKAEAKKKAEEEKKAEAKKKAEIPDDDKSPEQLKEKLSAMLKSDLKGAVQDDIQYYNDSLGKNLIVEVESVDKNISDKDIKKILVNTYEIISKTDVDYDSAQVNIKDSGSYVTKVKLENDGIWSIRNKNNKTTFENLVIFSSGEILINPR